jgi:hypothetical protein
MPGRSGDDQSHAYHDDADPDRPEDRDVQSVWSCSWFSSACRTCGSYRGRSHSMCIGPGRKRSRPTPAPRLRVGALSPQQGRAIPGEYPRRSTVDLHSTVSHKLCHRRSPRARIRRLQRRAGTRFAPGSPPDSWAHARDWPLRSQDQRRSEHHDWDRSDRGSHLDEPGGGPSMGPSRPRRRGWWRL